MLSVVKTISQPPIISLESHRSPVDHYPRFTAEKPRLPEVNSLARGHLTCHWPGGARPKSSESYVAPLLPRQAPPPPLWVPSMRWGVLPTLLCVHSQDTGHHNSHCSPFRIKSGPSSTMLSLINLDYKRNQS